MSNTALILFGATGDLVKEKLFPALDSLCKQQRLPKDLTILAVGRREYDTATFIAHLSQKHHYSEALASKISYFRMDLANTGEYLLLAEELQKYKNRLFYLAVPPDTYGSILQGISASGSYQHSTDGWSRIAVEKPFGTDQSTARELNTLICSLFHEENTYRIDHYLGKDTVENILAFRFTNPLFEAVWNNQHIDHIQITSAESIGLEGRTTFYRKIGATRDLIQNHLLQLITLLTIETPQSLSFDGLADAKMAVLRAAHADPSRSLFGQYNDVEINEVLGETESYAMTTFFIDNPRWNGVPIYVRTGKKLAERVTEVSIYFKPTAQNLFTTPEDSPANVITFRIQPNEGVFVRFSIKVPGEREIVDTAQMVFCYDSAFRIKLADAYENLFEALFTGAHMVALRSDVIEESWRIIDELLQHRAEIPFESYQPGSWGPGGADAILVREGRAWRVEDQDVCNGVTIQ